MPILVAAELRVELERLDLLLHRELLRLRAGYQLSLDELRGLYVSDEQVDQLVARAHAPGESDPAVERFTDEARAIAERLGDASPLGRLARDLGLDGFERPSSI
jgi:hypothetical protein